MSDEPNQPAPINTGGVYVEGSVNAGGDVVGRDKITNIILPQELANSEHLYRQFAQVPKLSRYIRIREFQTLVNERTKNFVGRDFIIKALDGLVQGSRFASGYIVIRGEPGIGKTALMAQLAKTRGYLHHFNIAAQNIRSVTDFLSNVCAQLIIRYELDYPVLPENATKDSGFLVELLSAAVGKEPQHRLVVLVDALDEAEDLSLTPDANRLYLPAVLPEGVFMVVTTREKSEGEYRLVVDNREDIYFRDDDPANLEDVRQYVRNYLKENETVMRGRITAWGVPEADFVEGITEKSQGNFMYLVHVLRDIRDGQLTAANVDRIRDLPLGLKEYYQRHWRVMRDRDREHFDKYQKPVICILATVREPVTIDMVAEWTKLASMEVKEVMIEWRQFLNEDKRADGEPAYRVYHTSFQDFLRDTIGLKPYHRMISQSALRKIKWPGMKRTHSPD